MAAPRSLLFHLDHVLRRHATAVYLDLEELGVDLLEVGGRQLDMDGVQVLFQVVRSTRTGDRDDPRLLRRALYAWELERGRRNWRVPVRGGVVTSDGGLTAKLAEQGLGLVYAFEPTVLEQLRTGRLQRVLERYAPTVPGFFLYFPSVARRSAALRHFVEAAKELAVRGAN
jgi:hypothetical protein